MLLLLLFLFSVCFASNPEQIHLSYHGLDNNNKQNFNVNWVLVFNSSQIFTKNIKNIINNTTGYVANESFVRYCSKDKCYNSTANYQRLNTGKYLRFFYNAQLTDLNFDTNYNYTVGDNLNGWSNEYNFNTLSSNLGSIKPLKMAVYGDYGLLNDRSQKLLEKSLSMHYYDLILHVGDLAYNLYTNDATVGDAFMNQIEPYSSKVPYMVCPGNHEEGNNFTQYLYRFTMPYIKSLSDTNLYYSFDIGDIHIIAISTEIYYFGNDYTNDHIDRQYNWLVNDLEKSKNSKWKIMFGHRPMYCTKISSDGPGECSIDTGHLRDGWTLSGSGNRHGALEHLLMDYNIDFYFAGHMHSYERLWPTYRQQVLQTSYNNLKGPIHIITGSAGCQENLDKFDHVSYPWSAFRSDTYGFGILEIYNNTNAYWKQVLSINGSILDEINVSK